jgi:hypothetical protein
MSDSDSDSTSDYNARIKELNKSYKHMNAHLKLLNKNALVDSLAVKCVTKLDGNCIFQSMCNLGYCDDPVKLRTSVAVMLYRYRNYKGYFKSQPNCSPKELFDSFSEDAKRKKVINNGTFKIIDYTYTIMCRDLSCDGSWDRIWVQFVFITLSLMFDVQIRIYQDCAKQYGPNEDKTQRYDSYEADDKKTYKNIANIGYINKCHYVPLAYVNKEQYNSKELPLYKLKPLKVTMRKHKKGKTITI